MSTGRTYMIAMKDAPDGQFDLARVGFAERSKVAELLRTLKASGWQVAWEFRVSVSCDVVAEMVREGEAIVEHPSCTRMNILDETSQSVFRAGGEMH